MATIDIATFDRFLSEYDVPSGKRARILQFLNDCNRRTFKLAFLDGLQLDQYEAALGKLCGLHHRTTCVIRATMLGQREYFQTEDEYREEHLGPAVFLGNIVWPTYSPIDHIEKAFGEATFRTVVQKSLEYQYPNLGWLEKGYESASVSAADFLEGVLREYIYSLAGQSSILGDPAGAFEEATRFVPFAFSDKILYLLSD